MKAKVKVKASTSQPSCIVGIGGAAGALNAYQALLHALPSDTGMAFAIVSNIHFAASNQLVQVLSKHTKMRVLMAAPEMPIRANHVYVIPTSLDLQFGSYSFKSALHHRTTGQIDSVFISLAEAMGARAIGIIVSGYFGDGIVGCRRIKVSGGKTFAQDMSAEIDGLPLTAQVAASVDFVLPPRKIPPALRTLVTAFASRKKRAFDPEKFLSAIGEGRKIVLFSKGKTIYTQGDPADAIFFIQKGNVKLTVVSESGKEATVGILNPRDFCGENCLAGQVLRIGSAAAMTDCELMRIEKRAMLAALHRENLFSDMFTAYLLGRNIRYESDLIAQLFSSSEKRLARALLLLANFGKEGTPVTAISKISQETLAEMVGTTRSRVNFFMNKFRKLGFIEYNGGLTVHSSLLNVVVHEKTD